MRKEVKELIERIKRENWGYHILTLNNTSSTVFCKNSQEPFPFVNTTGFFMDSETSFIFERDEERQITDILFEPIRKEREDRDKKSFEALKAYLKGN